MGQYQWLDLVGQLATSIWMVAGPLVGIFVGAEIASRNQRRHWVADNKKDEYRELMTALSQAFDAVLEERTPMVAHGPDQQRAIAKAKGQVPIIIGDRVFIAEEVKELRILDRWMLAVRTFFESGDEKAFALAFVHITHDLSESAKKVMS
jgi:hypothetical protein